MFLKEVILHKPPPSPRYISFVWELFPFQEFAWLFISHMIITSKMAKTGKMDMNSLNGPLADLAAMNTHKMAITRDYISQPRISKWIFSLVEAYNAHYSPFSPTVCPEQHRYAIYVGKIPGLSGPGYNCITYMSSIDNSRKCCH